MVGDVREALSALARPVIKVHICSNGPVEVALVEKFQPTLGQLQKHYG